MTVERAKRMVRQYTGATVKDAATVDAIANRMVSAGECVWHAAAQVTGKPCWCADCLPR